VCCFSHINSQENGEEEKAAVEGVIKSQQAVLQQLAANRGAQATSTPLNVNVGGGAAARSQADVLSIKEIVLEMLSANANNPSPHTPDAAAGTTVRNSDGSLTAQV
jgi:hypothetical protein